MADVKDESLSARVTYRCHFGVFLNPNFILYISERII